MGTVASETAGSLPQPSIETRRPNGHAPALDRPSGGRSLAYEGFFQSSAQGLGETYLSALAVWLGAGSIALGLVGTLPTAATAFAQVAAARSGAGRRGARAFVGETWLLQACALTAIGCFALLPGYAGVPMVCAGAALAWCLGGISVPAWTSLVSQTVPRSRHGWFFGLRGSFQQIGVVGAILGGGAVLTVAESAGATSIGFVLVFALSGALRAIGTGMLFGVPERNRRERPSSWNLVHELVTSAKFRRLATYLWTFHFAVWVAAPFFLPYMLRDLRLTYAQVGVLIAIPAVVKALSMRWWGRLADRIGPGPLLRSATWYVLPVPAMWLVSGNVWWLALVQFYAGLSWGAFELAQASALLQTTRGRESAVAMFNFVDGGAMILGSVVGGLIARGFDAISGSGVLVAIAASAVLRALTAVALARRVRRIGMPAWSHLGIPLRLWGVRPARGATFRPWADLPPGSD